jgi:CDP-paratose 2-epimerase
MTGRLLVTGGGGFVGSYTARHFARDGWRVVALDNLSRSELLGGKAGPIPPTYNWERLSRLKGVRRVKGDVRRPKDVRPAVEGVDAIVHTAAQVAVTSSLADPRTDLEVNLLGTFNVLEAARRSASETRLIFCSTNKVYGDNVNRIPVREEGSRYVYDDPTYRLGIPADFSVDGCEHTPYGVSKLAADLYVQDYARTYGLKTAVFRMSCIYGEGQSGNEDQGWVAHFVISILAGRGLTVYGDGKQVRDVLHVEDLARAFSAALRSDSSTRGRVFNIGGGAGNTTSLLELVHLMKRLTGKKADLGFADWRPGDQKVYISDILQAKETFGWEPEVAPEEGVGRLVRWYVKEFGA